MAQIDQKILCGIRQKLLDGGSTSLFDEEILSLILHTGGDAKDVLTLSKHLLARYGGLSQLSEIPILKLATETKGMSEIKAISLKASTEFSNRLRAHHTKSVRISCAEDLALLVHERMLAYRQERFSIALLNTKHELIAIEEITVGTINASLVHAREIFRPAILNNAYSIILLHNHPSGDATPSTQDKCITDQMKKAGDIIGINVLDHIIIGSYQYYSFEEGLHTLELPIMR